MTTHAKRHTASTVGQNIKAARTAKGWTQRELAGQLDTDTLSVSRWERGANRPSAIHEAKLADLLFGGDVAALYMAAAA